MRERKGHEIIMTMSRKRRRRQPLARLNSFSIILFLCILFPACHCTDAGSQEVDNNGMMTIANEVALDATSAEMARRIINRMKEVKGVTDKNDDDDDTNSDNNNDVRKSWDTLIQLIDTLASQKINDSTGDNLSSIHHHHLSHNEARKRALYWLSHQDTYEQKEVGAGFLHRYALAVIYFSLEGDSWNRCSSASHSGTGSIKANDCPTDKERFLSTASHRFWDGVNGNRDDTITWLDLSNRNVYSDNFLPLELTLLSPTLELLWISENPDLSGSLPEYIGEFQKLVSLNVHKTGVGGALPASLYTLKKLSSLRLYKSNFEGSISPSIGNMGRLKWLWIHDNGFTGTVPSEIGHLKKLEGVTMHGNEFEPFAATTARLEVESVPHSVEERLGDDVKPNEDNNFGKAEVVNDTQSESVNHHKKDAGVNGENDTNEAVSILDAPKHDTEGDNKQNNPTEANDLEPVLRGNIIPESLCSLMKEKKLKHLWTDCEDDAFGQGEDAGLVVKDGTRACSCCTKCFPKKSDKNKFHVAVK